MTEDVDLAIELGFPNYRVTFAGFYLFFIYFFQKGQFYVGATKDKEQVKLITETAAALRTIGNNFRY
jgi:hypothetical protein